MSKLFTIGNDAELFFQAQGKIISCIGLVGGTKDNPRVISEHYHAVLEDNVAAEMNVPPADNKKDFKGHIHFVLNYLKQVAERNGCELAKSVASASLTDDQLMHPDAFVFGCDPDFNAWYGGNQNPRPDCDDPNFRCAGGHIHIGTKQDPLNVIKKMDLFLGVPSLLMDNDTERRKLYGKAGCFRFKPYGVEYRTLSNFWIWDDRLIDWAYDQTERALSTDMEDEELSDQIQYCINEGDKGLAKHLVDRHNLCVI